MSISASEVLVVLVVALLVIKPEKLPDAAFTLGKWFRWLRNTTHQLKREWDTQPLHTLIDESVGKSDEHSK